MIRSWGVVTLTGAAQPWFGDVLTAAVGLPQGNGVIPVTVASTTRYKVGDRIYLDPGQSNQDLLLVSKIASATVLNCISEGGMVTNTHAIGALVQLSLAVLDVQIQAVDGNAGTVWLGTDKTVTVKGGSAFRQLQKVAAAGIPIEWREINGPGNNNICRTEDGWMIGTASDYVCMAAVVL